MQENKDTTKMYFVVSSCFWIFKCEKWKYDRRRAKMRHIKCVILSHSIYRIFAFSCSKSKIANVELRVFVFLYCYIFTFSDCYIFASLLFRIIIIFFAFSCSVCALRLHIYMYYGGWLTPCKKSENMKSINAKMQMRDT